MSNPSRVTTWAAATTTYRGPAATPPASSARVAPAAVAVPADLWGVSAAGVPLVWVIVSVFSSPAFGQADVVERLEGRRGVGVVGHVLGLVSVYADARRSARVMSSTDRVNAGSEDSPWWTLAEPAASPAPKTAPTIALASTSSNSSG